LRGYCIAAGERVEIKVKEQETIMNPLPALALAISVSLIVSSIVSLAMTGPLRIVLKQLCLDSNATAFWIPFTTVMFYVAPLLFTMMFESAVIVPDLVPTLRTALAASLFGCFAALLVVGYQIARARPVVR
jgi:hypothetical protein